MERADGGMERKSIENPMGFMCFFLKGQRWPDDGVSQRGFALKGLMKNENEHGKVSL